MLDPISKTLLDEIDKHVRGEKECQKRKEAASSYWMPCPSCGKRVVKKELVKKGCYVCGWHGTEEEIEQTQIKQKSQAPLNNYLTGQGVKSPASGKKGDMDSYRTNCPHCGARVITEHLIERGCYICGYKPADPSKNRDIYYEGRLKDDGRTR